MIGFDKTEFILGNYKLGEFIKATSTITNGSNVDVTFTPANSSCSCTSGVVQPVTITPGSKSIFTITVSTEKSGKGINQVRSISLSYKLGGKQLSQVFRLKFNVI